MAASGTADPRICPGSFVVQRPLDFVQIDHMPMDIVVVDDLYRQPLGKSYLTLATVVITRCSLGFVVSLAPARRHYSSHSPCHRRPLGASSLVSLGTSRWRG